MGRVQPYADRRSPPIRAARHDREPDVAVRVIGLLLAAVGLYGITADAVERRTAEIGVRMALGADRASVVGMVLRGAFVQVSVGLALGIPAAIVSGALIASRLFDVRPWDPALLYVLRCYSSWRRSSRRSSRRGARRDWIRCGRYASNRVTRNSRCRSGQTR